MNSLTQLTSAPLRKAAGIGQSPCGKIGESEGGEEGEERRAFLIADRYNDTLRSQAELARNFKYVAVEPPLGSPQITYHASADQWTHRGGVLRCLIEDGAEGGREPVITIDDKELSWAEFGTMLCTYAGWGMRIEFTPDDAIHRRPTLEVREPEKK
jgi:hypothetical protein